MPCHKLTAPCRDCGRTGLYTLGRGLCARDWHRHHAAGTLDRFGPGTRDTYPYRTAAQARANCDRYAVILADEIRARRAAGRSLVLADRAPFALLCDALTGALVAAD